MRSIVYWLKVKLWCSLKEVSWRIDRALSFRFSLVLTYH